MEKSVENVENYWFSTGIPFLWILTSVWKSVHTGLHNIGYNPVTSALRYRQIPTSFLRKEEKKFSFLKKMLSKTVSPPFPSENFCADSPKSIRVSFSRRWKYFSYHVFTEERNAGKSRDLRC